jgi:CheY-like chemotaxis protein
MTTILIVEDNDMNMDMLSRRLERRGFVVLAAVDGQQGLDLAIAEKPDLILMDISLPVMDGYAVTRSIRAHQDEKVRGIPIIALTAHALPEDREKCLAAGCNEYASKPVQLPDLMHKIAVLLGLPQE